ncbi:Sorting nexin, cytoplasm-to-vacuole targeting pathway/endosomal [Salix suchowensis]|nr:Sorting nexin, cytoplasm-to-vacuole targeting pathway/endosomal [Salix suchowensis]
MISGSDPLDARFPEEHRVEVYIPPYLESGLPQPTFTIVDTDWEYGVAYTVIITSATSINIRASLIGADTSTHGNNMGQRTIFPAISCTGLVCQITAPPDNKICPPGGSNYSFLMALRHHIRYGSALVVTLRSSETGLISKALSFLALPERAIQGDFHGRDSGSAFLPAPVLFTQTTNAPLPMDTFEDENPFETEETNTSEVSSTSKVDLSEPPSPAHRPARFASLPASPQLSRPFPSPGTRRQPATNYKTDFCCARDRFLHSGKKSRYWGTLCSAVWAFSLLMCVEEYRSTPSVLRVRVFEAESVQAVSYFDNSTDSVEANHWRLCDKAR